MAKKRRKDKPTAAGAGDRKFAPEAGTDRSATTSSSGAPAIPGWLPATLFVGLTLLLFRKFVFGDQMLYGSDTLGLGYVSRAFYANALTGLGTFPRWAPDILGGVPFLEALAGGDSLYPPSALLLLVLEPYRALGWKLVVHVAAAGFFMFGWIRAIGGSRAAALVSGTAYMLAPFFVSLVQPGHDGRIFVTALAPLLFWAVEKHFVKTSLKSFTAIAFAVGLVIFTTHFQMAYFLFGGVGMFAIFRAVQQGREASARPAAGRFALFLAASLTGVGVAGVQFLPAVDYVTEYSRRVQTTREAGAESGVAWSSSWSMHPEEGLGMLVPQFVGNSSGNAAWTQQTYWGRNAMKNNHEYAGLVILLLAAVSFVGGARRGMRFFFTALGAVAFFFAMGTHTPVWRILYELVPGITLFRAPSQVIFLFGFAAATLGALGLDRLLSVSRAGDDADWAKISMVLLSGTGLLAAIALLASSGALTSIWTSVVYRGADAQRVQLLESFFPLVVQGCWAATFFAAATFGLARAAKGNYLAPAGLVAAVTLLVAYDAFRISDAFVNVIDYDEWAAPDAHAQAVLDRESGRDDPYRMLSFRQGGQDVMPALYGIELAAGHHPNDLSRYRELIGMVGSGLPQNLVDEDLRRLLNVRYVLWPDYQFGGRLPGEAAPAISRLQLQDGTPYESVYAVADLPRARLVGSAVVRSDEEAVGYMLSEAFDPALEVVLSEPSPLALDGAPSDGTVAWTERSPNRLALSVTTERPALLVIADNWFPAWKATVDGESADVLRAYHTLRAVPVPAGRHTVEMVYESGIARLGLWLTILLSLGLIGATGTQVVRERRSGREP